MTTPQFYFLLLVIVSFSAFAISLGAACIRYHLSLGPRQASGLRQAPARSASVSPVRVGPAHAPAHARSAHARSAHAR
jgi:hypothetical protein